MNSKAAKAKRLFINITVFFSFFAFSATSFAGIEEHSPNPGPDFEEWEVISIDMERAREEAENEHGVDEGVDESIDNLFGSAPMNQSQQVFYRNLELKWELAPYGLDWVPPSESDLLEGLVPSTLNAPDEERGTDSHEEITEGMESEEESDENLSELDGRLTPEEENQPMTGCQSTENGHTSLLFSFALFLFGWFALMRIQRFPHTRTTRS